MRLMTIAYNNVVHQLPEMEAVFDESWIFLVA